MARIHPVVDHKPTTFRALAKVLRVSPTQAARRYGQCALPVTMNQLRVWNRIESAREARDRRIRFERHMLGRTLEYIQRRGAGRGLTVQRIQQIAGRRFG